MLEGIALDKYTFYRDAYLQRRGSFDDDEEVEVLVPGNGASAPSSAASAAEPAASEPAAGVKKPAEPASAASR
jgi:phospholipid-binding lipoprotein MlaA